MHARTLLIADFGTVLKVPADCDWFHRNQTYLGEVAVHFKFELNALNFYYSYR